MKDSIYSDEDKKLNDNTKISETLRIVVNNLDELGYNAIKQVVGYLQSGDLGYISNHKNSRNLIAKLERNAILEALVRNIL